MTLGSTAEDRVVDQMIGSKVATANFDVRVPFTGPEQISLLKSKFLFSEMAFFVDAGEAFNSFDDFNNTYSQLIVSDDPFTPKNEELFIDVKKSKVVASTGISLRINVFGAIILEPYYAIPLTGKFQSGIRLNIIPGW